MNMKKIKVLSLFDGIGGARQALKELNIDCWYYASEVDKHAIQVATHNHPDIFQLGDVKKIRTTYCPYSETYGLKYDNPRNKYDLCYIDTQEEPFSVDLLIGGSPCFVGNTLITTKRGQKEIKNIQVGDYVLTHKGNWKKVLRVGGDYKQTRIIKGYGFLPIETTDNHPFLTKQRINKYIDRKVGVKRFLSDKYKWQSAKTLKRFESYVATPIYTQRPTPQMQDDFYWIVGRFLGDGWICDRYRNGKIIKNYSVKICCGHHELDILKERLDRFQDTFTYTLTKERTVCKFHIHSKWFAELMSEFGRGASNKEIPMSYIDMTNNAIQNLIDGYLSADGCVIGKKIKFFTVSKKLANCLVLFGAKIGYNFTIYEYKQQEEVIIEGRRCQQQPYRYEGFITINGNRQQYFIEKNYVYKPIKGNQKTNQIKRVYNLEVEGDNSYIANGLCVHNCQDLSIAKKDRKGLDGDKSGLFYEYVRILKEVKPKYFILENVASMGKASRDIISAELGVEPVMINSSLLTAQTRKRYYWVGALQEDGTYKQIEIPQPQDKGMLLKDVIESGLPYQDKTHSLTASYNGAVFWNSIEKKQMSMVAEPIRLGHFNKGCQGDRVYSVEGKSVCLSANGGGRGAKTRLYKINLPDGDYNMRKLTVNECCRLQGFPDNYCKTVSNTQGYKALGNSFTVPVIKHIISYLEL
jgi:DNA (cytosine-5)-methyltransferase 3A